MPVAEVGRIAQETVEQLLRGMHVNGRVSLRQPSQAEGEPITLDITGDDLGILIGRRGETLGAIQFITRLIVSHRTHQRTNIIVDVEGYKQRREHILQDLARRMAERVEQSGRPVELEAMPAYERRIVHLTLRDHPHVTTQSIGEGAGRKVTIIPKS
jgi:spoIIIJ-associated protein